jgi:predicted ATPase/class 3 adenylate cyclase
MEQTHSFGYWLRRRRKALDLTQEQLAQQVGCVVTTIKKIEADARRPSKQLAERLAEVLRIAAEERAAFVQAARAERTVDQLDLAAQPLDSPQLHQGATDSLPTGTLTFLFTDIEGSTQLWEQHPAAMRDALARHDMILRTAIAAREGVVVKSTGDGVLAAFPVATDALAMALDSQRALQAEPWGVTGPLAVRVALHAGSAEARAGDYFGPTLNRVARLLAVGHGSQILLSLAAEELVRDHLPPDVALRDLGAHRLKDLTRPEQIFQVVAPDLPDAFPRLRTLDTQRHNLPAQPTALIGREQEVATVCSLLRRADARLVTLTGPGGMGKTRLGLQVAADLLDDFTNGVYFVNLAPISDPAPVPSAIAKALGIVEAGGRQIPDLLKEYLRDKRMLLLLDNFEQVMDAAPLVSNLLATAPGLKLLVTSRMALHLYGEHEFIVPSLALPDRHHQSALEQLTQYEAVRLFIERAQAVKADFAATNENAPAVAEICYRLDGLPLAIELAAARVKLFSPQALLARLGDQLKFLTGGARDLPARQQTIRNTIDWSYQLLDDGEKMLFARLGVFVGGCTLEAAEAVCNADSDLPIDVVDGVAALVDKSLLRQEDGVDGEPRYTMLETIREYARERLHASGAEAALHERHAAYCLALAEEARLKIDSATSIAWMERLEQEHDNLRAALAWALEPGKGETALRLAAALFLFWLRRSYWSEGRRWLEHALVQNSGASAAVRAQALSGAGVLASFQSDYARAVALSEESLALFRGLDDKQGSGWALSVLAGVASDQGDYARAVALAEESLALQRAVGSKRAVAFSLRKLADGVYDQGDYGRAAVLCAESLALCQELGDRSGSAFALASLAMIVHAQGDYGRAAVLCAESLALERELGNKRRVGRVLCQLGSVARAEGNYQGARSHYEEALPLFREAAEPWSITQCLQGLAAVACDQDDARRAAQLLGAVEALREAIGSPLSPLERADYDHSVAAARAQLDAATFAAAWAAGRAMSLEQAIAEALAVGS